MNRLTNQAAAIDRVAAARSNRLPLVTCQNVTVIRKRATKDRILYSSSLCRLFPAANWPLRLRVILQNGQLACSRYFQKSGKFWGYQICHSDGFGTNNQYGM